MVITLDSLCGKLKAAASSGSNKEGNSRNMILYADPLKNEGTLERRWTTVGLAHFQLVGEYLT
jgi:hypothetical protein